MFSKLLIPLDGSALAEVALPAAIKLAQKFNSELVLFRVAHPPDMGLVGNAVPVELIMDLRYQSFQESLSYLTLHKEQLVAKGLSVSTKVVEGDSVADHILDLVDVLNIDTIVMSTHGRGGLSRWMYGSVADKVLRHCTIPIILIRVTEDDLAAETQEPVSADVLKTRLVEADNADSAKTDIITDPALHPHI